MNTIMFTFHIARKAKAKKHSKGKKKPPVITSF